MALLAGKSNYAYAVARVQAKRSQLIPPRDYAKILKMDVSEITRFVEDSVYKTEVDELATRFSGLDLLEAALTVNEERTYAAIRRMVTGPGGHLIDLFLDRYTVDTIKAVLRGKAAGATREELLKEMLLGDRDSFGVFEPVLSEDVKTPADVAATLLRAGGAGTRWGRVLTAVPEDAPASAYEDALDKAYYASLRESLEASKEKAAKPFLRFTRREIDARNILNAARWAANRQQDDFSPYVIPGGTVRVADIVALARCDGLDAFAEALQEHSDLYEGVREGLDKARANNRMAPFQAAVQRHMLEDLGRLGHELPLSVLPILLFLLQKHKEVVTLRAVARGKAAGLSEERLQELVA